MENSNFEWNTEVILRSFAKDGYTGFLRADGRLETYMDDDLVWTSYSVGENSVETEFIDAVNLVSGQLYA